MGIFRFGKRRRRRGAFLSEADRAAFFRWGPVCSGYDDIAAAAAAAAVMMRIFRSGKRRRRRGAFLGEADRAASAAGAAAGAAAAGAVVRFQNERTRISRFLKDGFPTYDWSVLDNGVMLPPVEIQPQTRCKEGTTDRDSSRYVTVQRLAIICHHNS